MSELHVPVYLHMEFIMHYYSDAIILNWLHPTTFSYLRTYVTLFLLSYNRPFQFYINKQAFYYPPRLKRILRVNSGRGDMWGLCRMGEGWVDIR